MVEIAKLNAKKLNHFTLRTAPTSPLATYISFAYERVLQFNNGTTRCIYKYPIPQPSPKGVIIQPYDTTTSMYKYPILGGQKFNSDDELAPAATFYEEGIQNVLRYGNKCVQKVKTV